MKNFPGHLRSPRMFKYKEKTAITTNIQNISLVQKIQHEAKMYFSKQ